MKRNLTHILILGAMLSILCIQVGFLGVNEAVAAKNSAITPKTSTQQHNGIAAQSCFVTVVERPNAVNLIRLSVANVTVTDGIILGDPGDLVNASTLTYYTFQIIDTTQSNAVVYAPHDFTYHPTNGSYSAEIEATTIPESNGLAVQTNFTYMAANYSSIETTEIFSLHHKILITLTILYVTGEQYARVTATAISTFNNEVIVTGNAVTATYKLINTADNSIKKQGNLSYSATAESWAVSIDMTDIKGTYNIEVAFSCNNIGGIFIKQSSEPIVAEIAIDPIPFIIAGGAAFVVILIIIVVVVKKKSEKVIDRSKQEKKSNKPLEIVEISRTELKKTKLGGMKKTPVKKLDEKGLIFNVPTWEVDEEEPETAVASAVATTETSAAVAATTSYTLHCPGCNSWYEVDEYEKLECPKCNTALEVAMWCRQCSKWFDVPEPMDVDCPICNQALKYGK
jgi:hypothetical protein